MSRSGPLEILKVDGTVQKDSYIVKLNPSAEKSAHLRLVTDNLARRGGVAQVTYPNWRDDVFHGYAGRFSGPALDALRHDPEVEYIEQDAAVVALSTTTQNDAPWGLARVCRNTKLQGDDAALTWDYTYHSSAGSGVDIYVLDSGVYIEHNDFESRARYGANFSSSSTDEDKVGHGTHCAGVAAGHRYGAAKQAQIISVKVLNDNACGWASEYIQGINWVVEQHKASGRPSIISMSCGCARTQSVNDTANSATLNGVHFCVAAGNDNGDANKFSPQSADKVITVGASNISDEKAGFSNWGTCLDIFGPGQKITSCGIDGPDSSLAGSGTSLATPHVAGIIACLLSRHGSISPVAMKHKLVDMSLKKVLANVPSGTVNRLVRNDVE